MGTSFLPFIFLSGLSIAFAGLGAAMLFSALLEAIAGWTGLAWESAFKLRVAVTALLIISLAITMWRRIRRLDFEELADETDQD